MNRFTRVKRVHPNYNNNPQDEPNEEPVNWDWENEADKENDERFLFEQKEKGE